MHYISEAIVHELIKQADITPVIESAYIAMANGDAVNFPVVREKLNYADAIFGFKSGFDLTGPTLGVKAGGLWPGNKARGLANHQSTIVLFDPETGGPLALVRATYLTALRTAAASAISIRALARKDATCLGILGAGGQAEYQIRAALIERPFTKIVIADQSAEQALSLQEMLTDTGLTILICTAEELAANADVIITVTPSFKPILQSSWIKPGAHLACMGADTKGKQEVETALVARATLFGDEPAQAVTIGECQHAYADGHISEDDICKIGRVITGTHPGRTSDDEITLFDSTGVGLQDLAAASLAAKIAIEQGRAALLQ